MNNWGGPYTSIVQVVGSNSFLASDRDEALEIKRPATFGADSLAYSLPTFAVAIEIAVF